MGGALGGAAGSQIGVAIRNAARKAAHAKARQAGYAMLAKRLSITVPWQPAMIDHPAFNCTHCGTAHTIGETLLGCSACAAPYFPADLMRLSKNGRIACSACAAEQSPETMPFCCSRCRCIVGAPTHSDWRRAFTRRPTWRVVLAPLLGVSIGAVMLVIYLLFSPGASPAQKKDLVSLAEYGGLLPLGLGIVGLIMFRFRKRSPSEMMLACGGFGYRAEDGTERWFAWRDVNRLEDAQPETSQDVGFAHPDSTAKGWTVHTAQEELYFDDRLAQARELARQIRMRAPSAELVDQAPIEPPSPLLAIIAIGLLAAVIGLIVFFTR